jgi:hypothetical protein
MEVQVVLLSLTLIVLSARAGENNGNVPQAHAADACLPPHSIARLGSLRFKHADGQIWSARFSRNGRIVASFSSIWLDDRRIRIWDAASGRETIGPWNAAREYCNIAVLLTALNKCTKSALWLMARRAGLIAVLVSVLFLNQSLGVSLTKSASEPS